MPVMMPPYALRYSLANGRVRSMAPGSHRLWPPGGVCASSRFRVLSRVASPGHAALRAATLTRICRDARMDRRREVRHQSAGAPRAPRRGMTRIDDGLAMRGIQACCAARDMLLEPVCPRRDAAL